MASGIFKSDKAICDSIPYPYSCVHVVEYYGEDAFPMPSIPGSRRFPRNRWVLCKYDKRIEPDLDALALAKAEDREDTAKINRIKGKLLSDNRQKRTDRQYGDFKNPIECCQYLLELGVLKAMPKAVIDKQEQQLNGNGTQPKSEKPANQKPTHLTKLENAPEYIMVLRVSEMLEFFGGEKAVAKAVTDTLSHLKESEEKWEKYVTLVRQESEVLGLNPDEIESDLQRKKKARIEKLASTLTLDYEKNE